ncbi:hypothetical protein EX30DRAFT_371629 [Ascodesmis nigricans]|uniref:Uncharacterized protein n=1 Tax=Ascodesmis nigricans TaxID=341454 RepID=A0A4S2MX79_9PEZI|nr:hypothetical protein EX30DRAFT_371629 [Ascodesmis nigricans]
MDDLDGFSFIPPSQRSPKPLSPKPTPSPPPEPTPTTAPPTEAPPPPEDRQCRICLDTIPPPYLPSPTLGRLISPCTCTGSSRYVHSGCLQRWRSTSHTAYYQCPTCHYRYRLRRLTLSTFLKSTLTQLVLTSTILLTLIFALGFVARPVLNGGLVVVEEFIDPALYEVVESDEIGGWGMHFLRGIASLGVMGFVKVVYFLGPGAWWNVRAVGRWSGRERARGLGWVVVAIGVLNFFVALWKLVGGGVERWMEMAAVEVMEVGDGEAERGGGEEEQGRRSVKERVVGAVVGLWGVVLRLRENFVATVMRERGRPHLD